MVVRKEIRPPVYDKLLEELDKILKESRDPLSKKVDTEQLMSAIKKKIKSQEEEEIKKFTSKVRGEFLYRFIYSLVGDLTTKDKLDAITETAKTRLQRYIVLLAKKKRGIELEERSVKFGWSGERGVFTFAHLKSNEVMVRMIAKIIADELLKEESTYVLNNLIRFYSEGKYSLQTLLVHAKACDFDRFAGNAEAVRLAVRTGREDRFPITKTVLMSKKTADITQRIALLTLRITEALGLWETASCIYEEKWKEARRVLENDVFMQRIFGMSVHYERTDTILNRETKKALIYVFESSGMVSMIGELSKSTREERDIAEVGRIYVEMLVDYLKKEIRFENERDYERFLVLLIGICGTMPQIIDNPSLLVKGFKGT